jgi:hypothetical protein
MSQRGIGGACMRMAYRGAGGLARWGVVDAAAMPEYAGEIGVSASD